MIKTLAITAIIAASALSGCTASVQSQGQMHIHADRGNDSSARAVKSLTAAELAAAAVRAQDKAIALAEAASEARSDAGILARKAEAEPTEEANRAAAAAADRVAAAEKREASSRAAADKAINRAIEAAKAEQ